MEALLAWVAVYGPAALFALLVLGIVGLPIPDETLLVFSGYLISAGKMNGPAAFLAAVAGSWCGITISYWIGRTLGLGVVHRFGKYLHLNEAKLQEMQAWFNRRGHWSLFIGYYIAGVRHVTALLAGASRVEFRSFALYAWSGGFCWVSLFLGLGYYVGADWRRIFGLVTEELHFVTIGLVLAAVAYGGWLWRRSRIRSAKNAESESPEK